MKKTLILAALLTLSSLNTSNADVLLTDDFNYSDGSLTANTEWFDHSGAALDMQVVGGQVNVLMDGSGSEDVSTLFTAATGVVYYGLDFSVGDLGAPYAGTDNEYFAHFRQDGTNNFAARVDIVAATGGGDFTVGIASDESTADAVWASDLSFGTTYRLVVGYDQDANIAQMWIDATLETDASVMGEDRADPGDPVNAFSLRQSNSDGDELILVDNLSVGTTFGDVATFNAVPEPASAALIGLFGITALLRRRK